MDPKKDWSSQFFPESTLHTLGLAFKEIVLSQDKCRAWIKTLKCSNIQEINQAQETNKKLQNGKRKGNFI